MKGVQTHPTYDNIVPRYLESRHRRPMEDAVIEDSPMTMTSTTPEEEVTSASFVSARLAVDDREWVDWIGKGPGFKYHLLLEFPNPHIHWSAPGGSNYPSWTSFRVVALFGSIFRYLFDPTFMVVGVCVGAVCFLVFMVKRVLRTKSPLGSQEVSPPSILVYPAQNGQAPHFLTKEINFSLPSPRSSSLNELNIGVGVESNSEDTLAIMKSQQRSNSFTASTELGMIDPSLYQENFLDDDLIWPEGHVGRLWFSLRYETSSEKLLVTLIKAKNLPSRTIASINTCDPYVKIQLMPDERRTLQSKQKKKTCNPFFEETLVFQVSAKSFSELILKMTVVDGGRPKARQTLGHVLFPLAALPIDEENPNNEPHLYKLDLEKDPQEPTSDLGEMLVSLLYNENLHRLTVTVIEGKRLKVKGDRRQVYVRVTMNQQYKAVKSKKSRWALATAEGETAISECFHFRLPPNSLPLACVTLHVLQAGAKCSRDKVIGKFVLGSFMFARGKALEHWNSALANPMEQVQHWHALSI